MKLFDDPLLFVLGIIIISTISLMIYYLIDNIRFRNLPTEQDDEDDNSLDDKIKMD